jgi:hypothetical protein
LGSNPKLPLSIDEKKQLRKAKVKIGEIHTLNTTQIVDILDISRERARLIKALAEFQKVPSIGYELAEKLVIQLDVFSLEEISNKDGAQLFDELEQKMGVWTDSCVEDQIRCVINYANNPLSSRKWFDFTEERKAYRKTIGYPEDRPKKAWYDKGV